MFLTVKVITCVFTQLTKEEGRGKKKIHKTTKNKPPPTTPHPRTQRKLPLKTSTSPKQMKTSMLSQLVAKDSTQVFSLGKHGVLIVSHFMMVATTQAGFVCMFLLAF